MQTIGKKAAGSGLTAWILGFGLLFATCLLSHCKAPRASSAVSHVAIEIAWSGSSAEVLQNGLSPLLHQCALAVIEDDRATLHFTQPLAEVESLLKSSSPNLPADATVKSPVLIPGAIPVPPVPTRKTRFVFELNRDKLNALGITPAQLNAQLAGIPSDHDFSKESIAVSDGRTIPYADLGVIHQVEVMRPLAVP